MMANYLKILVSIPILQLYLFAVAQTDSSNFALKWKKGFLDIHFIHTGKGNSSFFIFPDGTTMLFDAGDAKQQKDDPYYPAFDTIDKSAGKRIAEYVKYFAPNQIIDFAVISHFHNDHFGEVTSKSPLSKNKEYRLTGITEVGDEIPIKFLIDRDFPKYNYPCDLRKTNGIPNETLINYLKFINYQQSHTALRAEKLIPGKNSQIILLYDTLSYKNFEVRNVKVNQFIWLGKRDEIATFDFKPSLVNEKGYFNENPLSIALKITYGNFDYFVGGDIPGIDKYPDYDLETPIANIIGEVDALTLNHHGYKDASGLYYLSKMKPKVIIQQALHDTHFNDIVQDNLMTVNADVFTLHMSEDKKNWYRKQVKKIYKSTNGNFFIRVYPGGRQFYVFVLDHDNQIYTIKKICGPYHSE